jgi:UrcA family protein
MTRSPLKSGLCVALLAGVASFAALQANAQDIDRDSRPVVVDTTTEEVIVQAPYFRAERGTVFGLPGKVSLSRTVSYSDLDLTSYEGAHELKARVADMARQVCDELRDAYPVRQQPGETKCFEGAYRNAMIRADAAIRDARYGGGYYRTRYSGY